MFRCFNPFNNEKWDSLSMGEQKLITNFQGTLIAEERAVFDFDCKKLGANIPNIEKKLDKFLRFQILK